MQRNSVESTVARYYIIQLYKYPKREASEISGKKKEKVEETLLAGEKSSYLAIVPVVLCGPGEVKTYVCLFEGSASTYVEALSRNWGLKLKLLICYMVQQFSLMTA